MKLWPSVNPNMLFLHVSFRCVGLFGYSFLSARKLVSQNVRLLLCGNLSELGAHSNLLQKLSSALKMKTAAWLRTNLQCVQQSLAEHHEPFLLLMLSRHLVEDLH